VQIKLANSGGQVRHTYLCIRVPLDCTPAITTDLADEHVEHDERAGPGQVRHDGAVHDRHQLQPAAAMVLVIDPAFSRHMCSTWKVSSKLATSSSSSAAVGETATHASRSSLGARTVVTASASDAANCFAP
jgi:hypothetical protein